jgi:hypothetical protein
MVNNSTNINQTKNQLPFPGLPHIYFLFTVRLRIFHVCRNENFRNSYLSFYWKKWFYIWYMALTWWLVLCLPFPGLPHIYFLFTVRLRIFHVCRNENFRNSYLSFYWKKWFYIWKLKKVPLIWTRYGWPTSSILNLNFFIRVGKYTRGSVGWFCVTHLSFCFEKTLYRTFHRCFLPNFGTFGYSVSDEKIFLEIDQSETRTACSSHVCYRIRTKWAILIEDLP